MHNRAGNNYISSILEKYSIFFLFAIVILFMIVFAPNFLNVYNFTTIFKGASLNVMVAIGFTIVLITGQMDLSISSNLTLGSMIVIGFYPYLGWRGSLAAAVVAGAAVGLINGLLVAKAKIHSFIVTLGTMTIVQGTILACSSGNAVFVNDYTLADFLEVSSIPVFPPRVLITIAFVIAVEFILTRTPYGRGFFMVGGNKETAWLAGLKTDRYLISAFVFSGVTAAFGGALFGMSLSSASPTPTLGAVSMMTVIAATIIGGTSLVGGKGSVLKSFIAVLTLTILFNGLNLMGAGYEIQIFASGFVLSAVVLYEAFSLYRQNSSKGQRVELLNELLVEGRKYKVKK